MNVRKVGYCLPVSRALMLEYGLIEPTPEEYDQMARDAADARERAAQQEAIMDAARARLAAIEDPAARAVLDLHRESERHECQGCDYEGHDAWAPGWPCSTVELIAQQYEVRLS